MTTKIIPGTGTATAGLDLSDADLDEIIGDGSCTHLPMVRMGLELRRRRNEKSADRALIVGLVTTAVLRARMLPDEAESIAARIADALNAFSLPTISDTDRVLIKHLRNDVEEIEEKQARIGNGADVELCRAQSALLTRLIGDAP